MSNLAKKVNNVLCGDLRRVNDLIKPVISKINDNIFCDTNYYLLSSCCGAGIADDLFVEWNSGSIYTPSALTIGDVFVGGDGACYRVTGYSTSYDISILPLPINVGTESFTPTIYTGCTDCINDSHPCSYEFTFCCTGEVSAISGPFSGSGGTVSLMTVNIRGNNVESCGTIGAPVLGFDSFPATGGTVYSTCEQCTSGGTKCFYEVYYCCYNTVTAINQGWMTGNTTFVDSNGDCYASTNTPVNGPATLTGTTSYANCADCLGHENPCLYFVTRCCDGVTGVVSLPGDYSYYFGQAFVDTNGDCWSIDNRSDPATPDVVWDGNPFYNTCCDCINDNHYGGTNCGTWEATCCYDPLVRPLCIPKYANLSTGDVITIFGICYEITASGCSGVTAFWDCHNIYADCELCGADGGIVDRCL
jgi:hypothetical protein